MKKIFIILLILTSLRASSKTIVLAKSGTGIYIKDASTLNYAPGDTLLISESIDGFSIFHLAGNKEHPVVIIANPDVLIGGYNGYSAQVMDSKFFKLVNFNIKGNRSAIGVKIMYCTDFSLENINIDTAAIGIQIKNNPRQNSPSTYYPTVIKNVFLKNCHVKNTGAEGFYLGHTFSSPLYDQVPSPIINLTVDHCTSENTGWDGFQVTNAQNCKVKNVVIKNAGIENQPGQRSGITLQDAVTGRFSDLKVNGCPGSGLTIFGNGEFNVKNVELKNVAKNPDTDAIFVDNRGDRGLGLPPKKLIMENIDIKGNGTGSPLYIMNGDLNGAVKAIPGIIKNFTYDKNFWKKKIKDFSGNQFVGGTGK